MRVRNRAIPGLRTRVMAAVVVRPPGAASVPQDADRLAANRRLGYARAVRDWPGDPAISHRAGQVTCGDNCGDPMPPHAEVGGRTAGQLAIRRAVWTEPVGAFSLSSSTAVGSRSLAIRHNLAALGATAVLQRP